MPPGAQGGGKMKRMAQQVPAPRYAAACKEAYVSVTSLF